MDDLDGRRDPRASRHVHRAGRREPVAGPAGRREPRPVRAHARRRVPGRRARPAREDRHGVAQHQPARPGALPHPARGAPAHRRRLVHLPHVRLRARPVGRDRAHHALHLHAGVRGAPAALRLVHPEPAGAGRAAPVRVRAPQPHAHRAQQARADAAGQRGRRARLGRPAHAHALRHPPARLPGGGRPRLRRRWSAWPRPTAWSRSSTSSTRCATCSTARRRAASACSTRSRWSSPTTPRARSRRWTCPTTPRTRTRARARCRSAASCGSSATTSWKSRCASSSAWRPAARCGCARRTSSPATRWSRTRRAGSWSCAARTIRRRAAATRPTAAAPRRRCTGSRPRTPSRPRSALYEHLFTDPYPGADGRDIFETINPDSEKVLSGCWVEPSLAELPVGETVQFERLGYFCPDPDSAPGALVFNRTLTLKDTWAKLQKQGRQDG